MAPLSGKFIWPRIINTRPAKKTNYKTLCYKTKNSHWNGSALLFNKLMHSCNPTSAVNSPHPFSVIKSVKLKWKFTKFNISEGTVKKDCRKTSPKTSVAQVWNFYQWSSYYQYISTCNPCDWKKEIIQWSLNVHLQKKSSCRVSITTAFLICQYRVNLRQRKGCFSLSKNTVYEENCSKIFQLKLFCE
jgi:hypothetical protein